MTVQLQTDKQTELMKKYGPQETTYATSFEQKDYELLLNFFRKIKSPENPPEIREYFDKLEQKYNDHDPVIQIGNRQFRFVDVAKTTDIPTVQGMEWCMRRIIVGGVALALFRFMSVGSDNREARSYQPRLFTEVSTRMDMTVSGSITRVDESMRFTAVFPNSYPTITVRESGIWNISSGTSGTMLNRNEFSNYAIPHVQGALPFTIDTIIEFASDTRWL